VALGPFIETRGRRRRRGPRRAALAAALAVLAGAAAVVAVWPRGGRHEGPVARAARLALTPEHGVAHVTETWWTDVPAVDRDPPRTRVEQWASDDPMRWRVLVALAPGSVVGDREGMLSGRVEYAYADGTVARYVARRHALDRTTGYAHDDQAARVPGLLDPLSAVRSMLDRGELRDAGTAQVGARRVRRLVGLLRTAHQQRRTTLLVDARTARPLSGSIAIGYEKQRLRFVTRFRVLAYERLPEDRAGRALLSIHPRPTTTTRTRTLDAALAEQRRESR
jgi:hypothetical protein